MVAVGHPTVALVAKHQDIVLDRLLDYLRQPSESATGHGFPEATDRAVAEMRLAGLAPAVLPTEGRPAVVGRRQGPPGTPTVLIYGHYDVQPPGPREFWRTDPYAPTIDGRRIWCRGAADNKGQHFAHLQALRLLLEHDAAYPCSVIMLLDGEEEVGSPHLADLVREHRDRLACDVVIWSDGPVHDSGQWCILHGVRGILGVRLDAHGANRALHSGHFGNVAPNPAVTLVNALASLRSDDGSVSIDGFYDGVEPMPDEATAAFERLPTDLDAVLADIGLEAMDPSYQNLSYFERLASIPSLTINGISTGDLNRTIIPHAASARLDVRLVAGQSPERVFATIESHLARHAPSVTVTNEMAVPPSRTPLTNPFTPVISAAIQDVTGEVPLLVPSYGGTLPDYVWTQLLGVASLGIPIGNPDEANHAPNENLEIRRYLTGIAMSMTILRAIGTGVAPGGGTSDNSSGVHVR
jgi:acetylornithine deacetylase/succinyl-diaminopimelate desuccinylase-like protein